MPSVVTRTHSGRVVGRLYRPADEFGAVNTFICIALPCDASPLRRRSIDDSTGFLVDDNDVL